MEKARTVAKRRCQMHAVSQRDTARLKEGCGLRRRPKVRLSGCVVPRLCLCQPAGEGVPQGRVICASHFSASIFSCCLSSALFIHGLTRQLLRELYIRLIKGMDAHDRAGSGYRNLPAKKLLSEIGLFLETNVDYRVTGSFKRCNLLTQPLVVVSFHQQAGEESIRAVELGRPREFVNNGDNAFALFSRALGDELLDPSRKGLQRRRGNEGKLVPTGQRQFPQRCPESQAGIIRFRHAKG